MQILIRCTEPALLASQVFALDSAVEAKLHADGGGLLVLALAGLITWRLRHRVDRL